MSHAHPRLSVGGGENAAYALHQGFLSRDGWHSFFLAACSDQEPLAGRELHRLAPDPEALLHVAGGAHQSVFESGDCLRLEGPLAQLVQELRPDVIHLHNVLHFGLAVVVALRRWAPHARILLTVHEFLLLCPLQGQLRNSDGQRCPGPTLDGCLSCCSWVDAHSWLIRQACATELRHWVDLFLSPSQVLVSQCVANGWPADCFSVVENLLPEFVHASAVQSLSRERVPFEDGHRQQVFGFFGNCHAAKGLDLVLEAFVLVRDRCSSARLMVHGPVLTVLEELKNSPWRTDQEYVIKTTALLDQLKGVVHLHGCYQQSEIPDLMAPLGWVIMSSRWLENSPVVIQEARLCQTPLLVPALGGMQEKVQHGVDGWHFAPDSAEAMANAIVRCCQDPEGWSIMQCSVRPPLKNDQLLAIYEALYLAEKPY